MAIAYVVMTCTSGCYSLCSRQSGDADISNAAHPFLDLPVLLIMVSCNGMVLYVFLDVLLAVQQTATIANV